jgi:putative transposase
LVFFDALRVKICDQGLVRNKAIHIVWRGNQDRNPVASSKNVTKDRAVVAQQYRARHQGGRNQGSSGLWIEQNEGAKFWLHVMNESKNAAPRTFYSPWWTG